MMEELFPRFSHLSEKIFDCIDNASMAKCRKVSKIWCGYLDNQRFFQIRKINATVSGFHKVGDPWKRIYKTVPTQTIIELGKAVRKFYQKNTGKMYYDGLTPLHVAAGTGNLMLLSNIFEKLFRY